MRSRAALLPLLAFAVWVSLALPGGTQTLTCRALPLAIATNPGEQLGCSLAAATVGSFDLILAGSNLSDDPRRGIEDAGSVTLAVLSRDRPTVSAPVFAPDAAPGDQFGFSLSIAGAAFAVGARFGDAPGAPDAGAVYVFEGESTIFKVTAQDARPGAQFGASIALSERFLAVGAPQDDARGTASGAVYVFQRVQGGWQQQAKLVSSRTMPFDNFGASVALDSGTLAVGAPFNDGAGGGAGAVHVFQLAGSGWTEVQTLTTWDSTAGDQLGFSVALSGPVLAAGARRDDHSGLTDAGSVLLFLQDAAGRWIEGETITAGSSARSGDLFGGAVALSGTQLVAGASRADGDSGAAYRFVLDDGEAFPLGRIPAPPGGGGRFGSSVAASQRIAAAGAFAALGNAGQISLLDCTVPGARLSVELSDGVETVQPGQRVTYRVVITDAPAGTAVRHVLPPQLAEIASCRGEGCAPAPGLRAGILPQGGGAVFTVRGRVRSEARGRMVYEVRAVPPRGNGASPVRGMDEDRIAVP